MTEKWIVVTNTTHWGPFDSAAEAGEFLSHAAIHLAAPQSIILLKGQKDMLASLKAIPSMNKDLVQK